VVPFYATGELASETRPLDLDAVEIAVTSATRRADDAVCSHEDGAARAAARSRRVDVPALGTHMGHGQREGSYSATPHMARLIWRKLREYPLGLPRLLWKTIRLELAARRRGTVNRLEHIGSTVVKSRT
jgi:hypothetical protein